MKILITGGSGFIGSNLVKKIIDQTEHHVVNVDLLTYASNNATLSSLKNHPRYDFQQGNICDNDLVAGVLSYFKPQIVFHLAAESHVDRSIGAPSEFIQTNIYGTYSLLTEIRSHLDRHKVDGFKLIHVSTDEVYGSLGLDDPAFTETSRYKPNSPYAASKASSDLLTRAWHKTYKLPTITTHCSNNYGPYQNTEKFIPKVITNLIKGVEIPIYGNGLNIRDWVHVSDHCDALLKIMSHGRIGQTYCIGADQEYKNIDVVDHIIDALDKQLPTENNRKLLKEFVSDRLGHDLRYAINSGKITSQLDWRPTTKFVDGISHTVKWYIDNQDWWQT